MNWYASTRVYRQWNTEGCGKSHGTRQLLVDREERSNNMRPSDFRHVVYIGILCRSVVLSGTTSTGKSTVNITPVRILRRMTLKCVFFKFQFDASGEGFWWKSIVETFFFSFLYYTYSVISVCAVDGCLFSVHLYSTNDFSRSTQYDRDVEMENLGRHQ